MRHASIESNNIRIDYLTYKQKDGKLVLEAISEKLDGPVQILDYHLPEGRGDLLSSGITKELKAALNEAMESGQIPDGTNSVVVCVKNFTLLAKEKHHNQGAAQKYSHVFVQNTLEDTTSAMKDEQSKKTFNEFPFVVQVFILVDDAEGESAQKMIFRHLDTGFGSIYDPYNIEHTL